MKFKLIIPILLSCAYIAGSSVCFAAPAVTKAEMSETEALETTRTETEPVETETVTAPITEPPVTTPSYYDEILKYVGDENAPQLDENLQNNGLTIDKSVIDYSQKSMYTITSRSGDVFYLIINSSDGSIYFLNSVDTSDLTALLSEDSQKAGNEINQSALENIRQTEAETDISGAVQSKTETVNNKKTDNKKNILSTIIPIAVVGAATAIIIYIRRKKNNRAAYDDDFLETPQEQESESNIIPYNEAETEEQESVQTESENEPTEAEETVQPYIDSDDFEETEENV
jgi:hypothetical protein